MSLSATIRLARKRKGVSQEEMANALGVHKNTVLRWEKDQLEPKASDLQGICQFLEISPNLLLFTKEDREHLGVAETPSPYHAPPPPLDRDRLKEALKWVIPAALKANPPSTYEKVASTVIQVYLLLDVPEPPGGWAPRMTGIVEAGLSIQ